MKICAISFHCCPFSLLGGDGTGGMSVYLRELSSAITRFPSNKMDIFTRIQAPNIRRIKDVFPKVRVIHLKGGPERSIDRRHLYEFLPEFSENLKDFINREKENYDIIYSHYWLSGLVGGWIKHKFDIPLFHMYHTLALLKKRILEEENEHGTRLETEERLAYISDAIVSLSWNERKKLVEFYGITPSKVKVIYPGVNKNLFYPISSQKILKEKQSNKKERILLYVGRIEPVKGLMTIIEALFLLKKKNISLYDQIKLIVIGGGKKDLDLPRNKEFIRIKESMREKKLRGKVIFLGSKKQAELNKYYSAADVLIVPSLYESFGLVVIEALACGTPVIVSQIGEMRTIVKEGKNGFSFRPNDPFSLARYIERFFSQEKKLWDGNKISQDVIKRFSWERTSEETCRFFTRILNKKAFATTIFPHDESLRPT